MEEHIIYLDNNATTKIDPGVLEAMMPYLTDHYANASSSHWFGREIEKQIHVAREYVASLINSSIDEIIFTSGATEAINLAFKGLVQNSGNAKHIITISTEHPATLETCEYLQNIGFDITYLSVNRQGLIDLHELEKSLRNDTFLVSVMMANNETGVIQPIKKISQLVHSKGILMMTDATQAAGKLKIDVESLDVDLLALSAHKIYGPKGVGALYINKKIKKYLSPIIHGGRHEKGFRSGTLNASGIIGFGYACHIALREMESDNLNIQKMRNELEEALLKYEYSFINGNMLNRLPNTINICFPEINSGAVVVSLSNPKLYSPSIILSTGSACSSGTIEPSHVLISMGLSKKEAASSLRISLGRFNQPKEIKIITDTILKCLHSFRHMIA